MLLNVAISCDNTEHTVLIWQTEVQLIWGGKMWRQSLLYNYTSFLLQPFSNSGSYAACWLYVCTLSKSVREASKINITKITSWMCTSSTHADPGVKSILK